MNVTSRTALPLALVVGLAAVGTAAAEKGIHIPPGRSVSFTWYVNDGAGYRWDISSNGQVSDGTNDAYDGGLQLRLSGSYFSASSSQARMSKDGREVEIGPWSRGSIRVYRRIYIDPKVGYCRWIDMFENTAATPQTVPVQYYSNMGGTTRMTHTTSGKTALTDKDWGIVTGYSSTSSTRPAVVHVFATKGAKIKPRFRFTPNNDSLYYDVTLKVPARKTVALCLFEAQRRPFETGKKFLKDFRPKRELTKVPPPLRRIIINMGGATLTLGNLDLPRHEKHDLAVLRNDNELLGNILDERFDLQTFYGKLELPADRVVGINVPAPDDPHVQVVLVNGQVVAGRLLSAPLRIRLTNGNEMALPPAKLASATFALSPERPETIKLTQPTVVLRSGQRLAFRLTDLDCTYHTEHGEVKLEAEDLQGIRLDTPEGGLHRAVFRNGSVLSGLLVAERLKLALDLGPLLDVRRHLVHQFIFPAEEVETTGLSEMTLRNDDQLFGRIVNPSLDVATRYGKASFKPAEIAEVTIPETASFGDVRIKLHNGTSVTGKLLSQAIQFQLDPGPKLDVFLGHVVHITCPNPAPPKTPTSRPTPKPKPGAAEPVRVGPEPTPTAPAATPAKRYGATAARETLAKLEAELKELQARRDRLAKIRELLTKEAAKAGANASTAKRLKAYAKFDSELAANIAKTKAEIAKLRKAAARTFDRN